MFMGVTILYMVDTVGTGLICYFSGFFADCYYMDYGECIIFLLRWGPEKAKEGKVIWGIMSKTL